MITLLLIFSVIKNSCSLLISLFFFGNHLYLAPLGVYSLFCLINAVYIFVKYKEKILALPLLLILPFIAHISYGLGFASGLIKKNG